MQTSPITRFVSLAAFAMVAGVRRDGALRLGCELGGGLALPNDLSEYAVHARRLAAAAFIDLLCAVPHVGAAFFIPATLQRRYAAV